MIEALVATAILGIVIVSLYGAFSFGFRVIRVSQESIRADQLLLEEMEILRVYDWSKITNGTFIPTTLAARFSGSGTNGSGAYYTATIAVAPAPVAESYSNTLRQLSVSLAWSSGGISRNRSMTTLVSQYGIQTYRP